MVAVVAAVAAVALVAVRWLRSPGRDDGSILRHLVCFAVHTNIHAHTHTHSHTHRGKQIRFFLDNLHLTSN